MDDGPNIMENGVDLPKTADGTPRLLITKMVRDLRCILHYSRLINCLPASSFMVPSNPIYYIFRTSLFIEIRNLKILKVTRGQKSLVRSTNALVLWLVLTVVENRMSLTRCCSSSVNVHQSYD